MEASLYDIAVKLDALYVEELRLSKELTVAEISLTGALHFWSMDDCLDPTNLVDLKKTVVSLKAAAAKIRSEIGSNAPPKEKLPKCCKCHKRRAIPRRCRGRWYCTCSQCEADDTDFVDKANGWNSDCDGSTGWEGEESAKKEMDERRILYCNDSVSTLAKIDARFV
jgi:hypothetical protein